MPRRFGVVHLFVRTGVRERGLWIRFGRPKPTAQQLAVVNAQLRSVH